MLYGNSASKYETMTNGGGVNESSKVRSSFSRCRQEDTKELDQMEGEFKAPHPVNTGIADKRLPLMMSQHITREGGQEKKRDLKAKDKQLSFGEG
jgi:hypothetical protein